MIFTLDFKRRLVIMHFRKLGLMKIFVMVMSVPVMVHGMQLAIELVVQPRFDSMLACWCE